MQEGDKKVIFSRGAWRRHKESKTIGIVISLFFRGSKSNFWLLTNTIISLLRETYEHANRYRNTFTVVYSRRY